MKVLTQTPLHRLSTVAGPYPAHMLEPCETGLVLFAAAFLGANDAIHFARQELVTTCVDVDEERLQEMCDLYPDDWSWCVGDAWEFAADAAGRAQRWDAVSVDTFTGEAMQHSLDSLELWCSLATRLVTATITDDAEYMHPVGWRSSVYPRSERASWLVMTRA